MRNVLHIIETIGPGGAETVCRELARGLDPTRFQSFAILPEEGWLAERLREDGIPFEIIPLKRSADLGYLRRIVRLIRQNQIDIVQAHLLSSNLYAALAGAICRIPVVATFHGQVDINHRDRLLGLKCRLINSGARSVVFVSDHLRRYYRESTKLKPKIMTCIHNGIDPTRFRGALERRLRFELGIGDREILVGSVGNMRPAKGYDVLLRAAALLRRDTPDCRFVIIGDSPPPDLANELAALHRALGLDDMVRYVGFRANIDDVLRSLDIFVLTSRSEGFSIATVEAMAAGLPTIATRCGGPEEIIRDGEDGLLVENGSPEAVAAALKRLIVDQAFRERLGTRAHQTVLSRFSTAAMISSYTQLYEHLTHEPMSGVRRFGGVKESESAQHASQPRFESLS